jgi:hypothetical protein
VTLHEALELIPRESKTPITARQLADAVNERGLYRTRDGSPVEVNQIHARTSNYEALFASLQRLRSDLCSCSAAPYPQRRHRRRRRSRPPRRGRRKTGPSATLARQRRPRDRGAQARVAGREPACAMLARTRSLPSCCSELSIATALPARSLNDKVKTPSPVTPGELRLVAGRGPFWSTCPESRFPRAPLLR